MAVEERWAKAEQQIQLMYAARQWAGTCGWCGREIEDDESVYIEEFRVGLKRATSLRPPSHRSLARAPVGIECASPTLLQESEGRNPDPCAGCGRGVFYRSTSRARQYARCSRLCKRVPGHESASSDGATVAAEAAIEPWGIHAKWFRERRGLSIPGLVAALAQLGRRVAPADVKSWEAGTSGARIETFAALARVLGVTMDQLYYGQSHPESNDNTADR
jgi:hypothetical protein